MPIPIKVFYVPDPATSRDNILRTIKSGLAARGVTNADISPGTEFYVEAQGFGNEIAVVGANTIIKADAQMPDTALDSDLDRLLATYGLARRSASVSVGQIVISTTQSVNIPTGTQLIDLYGLRYQVTTGGTYTNTYPNNIVPVSSIDTGKQVNHSVGDVLRWVTAPPYCAPTVTVNTGGLTGGVDQEDNETARGRLLSRLQTSLGGGNWNQIAAFAEASSTSVQKAFVYPAFNGPATVFVALAGYAQTSGTLTSTSKNRDISSTIVNGTVVPYILGNLPEYVETTIASVQNQGNDMSFLLSLPASPAAVPAGPGGGWIDGTPWPTSNGTFCSVSSVSTSNVFTVNAVTTPVAGVTHIAFLDPTNWTLQRAKVTAVSGTSGAYQITIDNPFPNIASGNYIFPDAVNMQAYVNAVLSSFALLGPGEKSISSLVLTRGYRHPTASVAWPIQCSANFTKALTNVGTEVLGASILWQNATGSAVPANPNVPGTVAAGPFIFVPRFIGFYAS